MPLSLAAELVAEDLPGSLGAEFVLKRRGRGVDGDLERRGSEVDGYVDGRDCGVDGRGHEVDGDLERRRGRGVDGRGRVVDKDGRSGHVVGGEETQLFQLLVGRLLTF